METSISNKGIEIITITDKFVIQKNAMEIAKWIKNIHSCSVDFSLERAFDICIEEVFESNN